MNRFAQLITFDDLVHFSPDFIEARNLANRVAPSGISVFITSEPGCGSWQLASHIHNRSVRRLNPIQLFQPDKLTPSGQIRQLFGFEEAGVLWPGLLEQADGGTLVIDPIEALAPESQVRLFRALNSREFVPEGSQAWQRMDLRFIAVSRFSPSDVSRLGMVRDELLFRLEGVPVGLPALRFRVRDIIPLARRFMDRLAAENGQVSRSPDRSAAEALIGYSWPGNDEELFQVMERVMTLGDHTTLKASDLVSPVTGQSISAPVVNTDVFTMENDRLITLNEAREFLFRKAMKLTGNNADEAARLLGIGRATAFRMQRKEKGDGK